MKNANFHTMKRLCLLLLLLMPFALSLSAAIDPIYKECMQRGYSVDGDYCVFPDESRCLLDSFNEGVCGSKWLTDDYCVEEGEQVWDANRCCDGFIPYVPDGHDAQSTCQSQEAIEHKKTMKTLLFWGALLAVILLTYLYYRFNRNRARD